MAVPRSPSGELDPPPGVAPTSDITIEFDNSVCTLDAPETFTPNGAVRIEFVNKTATDATVNVRSGDEYISELPAGPGRSNVGYVALNDAGPHQTECRPEFGEPIHGPMLQWTSD